MVWKELLHEESCVVIRFIKQMSNHFLLVITFIVGKFSLGVLWKHWQWSNWK